MKSRHARCVSETGPPYRAKANAAPVAHAAATEIANTALAARGTAGRRSASQKTKAIAAAVAVSTASVRARWWPSCVARASGACACRQRAPLGAEPDVEREQRRERHEQRERSESPVVEDDVTSAPAASAIQPVRPKVK